MCSHELCIYLTGPEVLPMTYKHGRWYQCRCIAARRRREMLLRSFEMSDKLVELALQARNIVRP
jgi:hypothetical protein